MSKYFKVVREECLVDFIWYRKLYGDLAYEVPFYFYTKDSEEMRYLLANGCGGIGRRNRE